MTFRVCPLIKVLMSSTIRRTDHPKQLGHTNIVVSYTTVLGLAFPLVSLTKL